MTTNPIGQNKINLTVNVDKALHSEIKRLSELSDLKMSEYVRGILHHAIDQGWLIRKSVKKWVEEKFEVVESGEQSKEQRQSFADPSAPPEVRIVRREGRRRGNGERGA